MDVESTLAKTGDYLNKALDFVGLDVTVGDIGSAIFMGIAALFAVWFFMTLIFGDDPPIER